MGLFAKRMLLSLLTSDQYERVEEEKKERSKKRQNMNPDNGALDLVPVLTTMDKHIGKKAFAA